MLVKRICPRVYVYAVFGKTLKIFRLVILAVSLFRLTYVILYDNERWNITGSRTTQRYGNKLSAVVLNEYT